MKKQFLLTGKNITYTVTNGVARLYAVHIDDGMPRGRLYHFKTVENGGRFIDFPPVESSMAIWGCVVKYAGDDDGVGVISEGETDGADEFSHFVSALEQDLQRDAVALKKRSAYAKHVLSQASVRLAEVNSRLSKWSWDEFDDENEYVEVCKVLCNHLKVEVRVPSKDIAGDFANLAEEILYLSGIRYKAVALPEGWWKHNNGTMLGHLEDGTPVALMPQKLSGYRAYDPKRNTTFKVDADYAAKLEPKATALFRAFPAKKIGLRDIMGFILGENIYNEIAVIILCSFFANIVGVIPAILSEQIFDMVVPENLRSMLIEFILILIAFAIANVGFSIIVNLGVTRINTKGGLAMQAALWDRLLSLRVPFFNEYTTGELLQKIKGIDQVKNMISMETLQVVFTNLFSFINIIVLFTLDAGITPYVLLMFLALFIVHFVAGKEKYKLSKKYTDLENRAMSFNHQCIQGMHRIKVSCAEERVFNIWSAFEADKRSVGSKIKMIDGALAAFQLFFDVASTAVVFFLIAQAKDVAMGTFIAYISTLLIFQKSMRKLLKALSVLPELISVCMNVKPILDAEPEYSVLKTIPKDMDGTLEVNHATFRYGKYGRTIISDVSFRVEEGESVGIVGLSGGGKSTLLKILMGFYSLDSGKIYYGGYDIETIDLRYLRKQMGVVLQNGSVTVGDIYSTVADNASGVKIADVEAAIRKAGLEEMVSALPDGLHTRLENCALSDGEKQRLLIARAIVKKSKFIFLDEATSSLDNISQNKIMTNLRNISATKIIIAQRLATVQHCDKIIVIDRGKIVEQGSYEDILKGHALFGLLAKQT